MSRTLSHVYRQNPQVGATMVSVMLRHESLQVLLESSEQVRLLFCDIVAYFDNGARDEDRDQLREALHTVEKNALSYGREVSYLLEGLTALLRSPQYIGIEEAIQLFGAAIIEEQREKRERERREKLEEACAQVIAKATIQQETKPSDSPVAQAC